MWIERSWLAPSLCRGLAGPVPGQEHQPELADLYLIAALQRGVIDALAVNVGSVQAADVAYEEALCGLSELGMAPRDRHVVEEDVAFWMAACGGDVGIEQEPAAGVRTAANHQETGTGRQPFNGGLVGQTLVVGRRLEYLKAGDRDRRGRVGLTLGAHRVSRP